MSSHLLCRNSNFTCVHIISFIHAMDHKNFPFFSSCPTAVCARLGGKNNPIKSTHKKLKLSSSISSVWWGEKAWITIGTCTRRLLTLRFKHFGTVLTQPTCLEGSSGSRERKKITWKSIKGVCRQFLSLASAHPKIMFTNIRESARGEQSCQGNKLSNKFISSYVSIAC